MTANRTTRHVLLAIALAGALVTAGTALIVHHARWPVLSAGGLLTGFALIHARQILLARRAVAARVAAERADQTKSRYLATMSHAIRTPLSGILGLTDLLQDTPLNGEQAFFARTVKTSAESLLTVLDDILDLSRFDAGLVVLECHPFALPEAVAGAVEILRPQARAKHLHLEYQIDPAAQCRFVGDAARLGQVLLHLVGNAIQFTEAGSVSISVTLQQDLPAHQTPTLYFSVTDTGIGIADKAKPRLFDLFAQAGANTRRQDGGAGLGLALCRRLVEQMDGTIGFESKQGRGSMFYFSVRLPLATSAGPTQAAPDTSRLPAASAAAPERPRTWPIPAAPETVSGPASRPKVRRPRVLVAEDHPVNQRVATMLLAKLGYDADVAQDGAEAFEMVRANDYDLVLMEVQMPGTDGYTATRLIRALAPPKNRVKIVAMTANPMRGDREACISAGMDDYISKPVGREKFVDMLQRHGMGPSLPTQSQRYA